MVSTHTHMGIGTCADSLLIAFRSGAGRDSNRTKPTEDGARAPNNFSGRGRGGRDSQGRGGRARPTNRDDRHSKHVGGLVHSQFSTFRAGC